MKVLLEAVSVLSIGVMAAFLLIFYWAWAAWVLWNWYAPLAGIEQASFAKVYAFMTLFSVIKGYSPIYASDEKSRKQTMLSAFLGPIASILVGRVMLEVLR